MPVTGDLETGDWMLGDLFSGYGRILTAPESIYV